MSNIGDIYQYVKLNHINIYHLILISTCHILLWQADRSYMDQSITSKPKYETIMDDLLARIRNNDFMYDTAFCTEKQLSTQYNVSRITAKRAITDLEQRGILYRKRGVGSFVSRNALSNLTTVSKPAADSRMVSFLLPFDSTKGNLFQTLEVVNNILSSNGYFISLYISDTSSSKETANIKLLLSQNVSGLIYYPVRDNINLSLLNEFVFAGIPVVIIDKATDCPYIHNVVCDNFEGGRLLAKHLTELGHRNIAFFTTAPIEETSSVRNRFAGYLSQMQTNSISLTPNHLVYFPQEVKETDALSDELTPFQSTIRRMYSMGVTAIIAENDRVAQFIHMACSKIGLRIPEDISLCGFDDTEPIQELDITTIRQDFIAIGEQISSLLLTALSNPAVPAQKITIPVELIVRGSTDVPRI